MKTVDRRWLWIAGVAFTLVIAWNTTLFTVPQWMQAMVVQLGEPADRLRDERIYFRRGGVVGAGHGGPQREDVMRVEAGIDVLQAHEGADQEGGSDQ